MKRLQRTYIASLVVVLLFTLAGLFNLSRRPRLPFQLVSTPSGLQIIAVSPDWQEEPIYGAFLRKLDGYPVAAPPQVQTVVERKTIGSSLEAELSDGRHVRVLLQPYYSLQFLLVNALLAFCFFLVSAIVWKHARRAGERFFAVSALLFGYIIAVNWPGFQLPLLFSGPIVFLFFLFYPQAFLSFLLFCYHFPSPTLSEGALQFRKRILPLLGLAFSIVLIYEFWKKTFTGDLSHALRYEMWYRWFRVFILFTLAAALLVFVRNFKQNPNPANRKRFQWMLGGILWGAFPFVFLWNLPLLLGYTPLLPEWAVNLFILVIPVSVAIAIVKYRLFDIEIILSRSIVYVLVLGILFGIYVLIVGGASLLIYRSFSIHSPILSFISALGMALLFQPLKDQVQQFVNTRFFRIRYDRFRSLQSLMAALENCSEERAVLNTLDRHFETIIPTEAAFFVQFDSGKWKLLNYPRRTGSAVNRKLLPAAPFKVSEVFFSPAHSTCFESPGQLTPAQLPTPGIMAIAVGESVLWCLGKKRSGMRYWEEDVELARQMARAASLQLEKLELIRQAMQESVEKEHAQKVSRWKNLLVAEVAHDLRAPLNTMLWKLRNFQDSLSRGPLSAATPLPEIEKHIQRLQHFIQSLMILSRQEEGKFRIQRQTINVQEMIESTLDNLQGTIQTRNLRIQTECPESLSLQTDPVLFQEILLNLLDNAVKFSPPHAVIQIEASRAVRRNKEKLRLTIRDQAGGIPPEKLKTLFEPFATAMPTDPSQKGFHLGLYIVREFTRLLRGEIRVKSKWKQGTVFTLYFPGVVQRQSRQKQAIRAAK